MTQEIPIYVHAHIYKIMYACMYVCVRRVFVCMTEKIKGFLF